LDKSLIVVQRSDLDGTQTADSRLKVHAVDEVVGVVRAGSRQVAVSTRDTPLVSVVTADVRQRQHRHSDADRQSDNGALHAGRRPQHPAASHRGTHHRVLPADARRLSVFGPR